MIPFLRKRQKESETIGESNMKKKKILLAAVSILMVLALTACGATTSSEASTTSSAAQQSMFGSIWGIIAIPLGWIMNYCYILFNDILHFPLAYVFALFLFTIITKALMFPLSLKQQRSQASMSAFQPMMNEINKKYANNPEKRNEELTKLQQEYGYNPTAGCLPLLIQFPIIFGLVEVIYRPLTYMIRIPTAVLNALETVVTASSSRGLETAVIEAAKTNPGIFANVTAEGYTAAQMAGYIQKITDLDMSFGSVNLWEKPVLGFNLTLIIPLFSVVTMILSSIISMKAAGSSESGQNTQMLTTTIMMSVMFAVFSFMYPMGFSLYWGFQNVVIIAQSFILRKIVNVDTIKAEVQAKIEEKRKEKKKKSIVTTTDSDGKEVQKEVSGQELARMRLQRARELDEERYGESDRAALSGNSKYDT